MMRRPKDRSAGAVAAAGSLLQRPSLHYLGHRERLRERFASGGPRRCPTTNCSELVLFRAIPRARHQADRQGAARRGSARSPKCLGARPSGCRRSRASARRPSRDLKMVARRGACAWRSGEIMQRPASSAPGPRVLDYCRAAMAFEAREQFRILFLDKKNPLIADEVQQTRHGRPHAGLSARGGQARAGAVGHRASSWCTTTPPATRRRRAPTST